MLYFPQDSHYSLRAIRQVAALKSAPIARKSLGEWTHALAQVASFQKKVSLNLNLSIVSAGFDCGHWLIRARVERVSQLMYWERDC